MTTINTLIDTRPQRATAHSAKAVQTHTHLVWLYPGMEEPGSALLCERSFPAYATATRHSPGHMTIYRPTTTEIRSLTDRAARKWPHLAQRAAAAAQLLEQYAITWSASRSAWIAASLSDPSSATVYTVGSDGCTCTDYRVGRNNRAEGRRFCKHAIAFHAYRRILLDRLHALYVGEAYSDEFRRIKLGDPIVAQIPGDNRLIGPTLDGLSLDIRYRYSTTTRARDFASDADMLTAARWLPRALAELERMAAQEPAPEIWPPAGQLTPEMIMAYDAEVFNFDEWADLHLRPR